MAAALRAGVYYFAIVFASGFVLGALRVLVIAPRLGDVGAVAVELPVMLALSWFVCRWLVEREPVAAQTPRLMMGAVALVLLLVAEAGVSVLGFGRSLAEHLAAYGAASARLGLAGQVAFAAFPLLQARA